MSRVLANASSEDRNSVDFYPTPSDVTIALLNHLRITNKTIWEPACGEGHMVNILKEQGHHVIGTDKNTGQDFLISDTNDCEWIITNPPFSCAHEFIEKALSFKTEGVALLLKSQFWHAKKRVDLFRRNPPSWILPLSWRPDFLFGSKSGSPTMEVLWTVWERGHTDTRYTILDRPNVK